jgi:ABC-type transport system involved in multi-copper enzyme maturation permease subunit
MRDLKTMMWKEIAESLGNRRFLWVFGLVVMAMGILPALSLAHHQPPAGLMSVAVLFRVVYVLFATVIVVAQTAPDLVLHERVGHTLDYLLTTRLPDAAIFGGKVLVAALLGYLAALAAMAVQLVAAALLIGSGWHWLFLAPPLGRVAAFGMTADLSLYVAVIGTFVALRVGEQRTAYLATILAVGLVTVPFILGWLHFSLTMTWAWQATTIFGAIAVVLGLFGLRVFRREMLVLYLQD